jgi:hypothetical protein
MTSPAAGLLASRWQQLLQVYKLATYGNKAAVTECGMVSAVIAMEIVALANIGNPGDFRGPADTWIEDILPEISSNWGNIDKGFNDLVNGDWVGQAQQAFTGYVNSTLKPAADQLAATIEAMGKALSEVGGAVLTMDIAFAAFTVATTIFLNVLLAWVAASLGTMTPALTAATITYIGGILSWITALVSMINSFINQGQAVKAAAAKLEGALYSDVKSKKSKLGTPDLFTRPGEWRTSPVLDK